MRPAILICLFIISGYIVNAQLTILPQVGFESSQTSVQFNQGSSFSPSGAALSPQAAIRLDYKNKQGYGPFLGLASSRQVVQFNFFNPQNVMNTYTVSKGEMQIRLEGGYQLSSKSIYFKKSKSDDHYSKTRSLKNTTKKGCGSYLSRSSCGSKLNKAIVAKSSARGSWVKIQPSLGVAYNLFTPFAEIETKSQASQTSYRYNAGNWNLALLSGVGFEFGRNDQRQFALSINYLKGMDNLGTRSITTTTAGNKSTTVSLKSEASAWNVKIGIPISVNKKKPVAFKQPVMGKPYKSEFRCGQYKHECRRVI